MKEVPLRKTDGLGGIRFPFSKTPEELKDILEFPSCCIYTCSIGLGRLKLVPPSEVLARERGDKSSCPLLDSSSVLGLPSDSLQIKREATVN